MIYNQNNGTKEGLKTTENWKEEHSWWKFSEGSSLLAPLTIYVCRYLSTFIAVLKFGDGNYM